MQRNQPTKNNKTYSSLQTINTTLAKNWKTFLTATITADNRKSILHCIYFSIATITCSEDKQEKNEFGQLCSRIGKYYVAHSPKQARELFLMAEKFLTLSDEISWNNAHVAFSYMQEFLYFGGNKNTKDEAILYCKALIEKYPYKDTHIEIIKLLAFAHYVIASISDTTQAANHFQLALEQYENFLGCTPKEILDDQYAVIKSSYAAFLARQEAIEQHRAPIMDLPASDTDLEVKEFENPKQIFEKLHKEYWQKNPTRETNLYAAQFYLQFAEYYAMHANLTYALENYKIAYKIFLTIYGEMTFTEQLRAKITNLSQKIYHKPNRSHETDKIIVSHVATYGGLTNSNEDAEYQNPKLRDFKKCIIL